MPPEFVQVVVAAVASFLGGGAFAWRLLGRTQRAGCPSLAKDVTGRVHHRCAAYQVLEERINTVIQDFDRRDAELRTEHADETGHADEVPPAPRPIPSEIAVAATAESATTTEALSWMDACDEPADPADAELSETHVADLLTLQEGSAQETENVVDQFGRRLEVMQSLRTAELERHRREIETLASRVQALETWSRTVAGREPAAPAAATSEQSLRDLRERIARYEQEMAAWREGFESLSRERAAILETVQTITGGTRPDAPRASPQGTSVNPAAPKAKAPSALPRSEPVKEARPVSVRQRATPARPKDSEVAKPEIDLDSLPGLASSRRAAPGKVDTNERTTSQIGDLMKHLEVAKGEAETYRRKLHEQNLQFTAAYTMLDRMRPLVQALEGDLAAHARGQER
jgi:hypothetical protein